MYQYIHVYIQYTVCVYTVHCMNIYTCVYTVRMSIYTCVHTEVIVVMVIMPLYENCKHLHNK